MPGCRRAVQPDEAQLLGLGFSGDRFPFALLLPMLPPLQKEEGWKLAVSGHNYATWEKSA